MKIKVLAAVSNHIATDQRLKKVGTTLLNAGYDFHLIGFKHRGTPTINVPFSTQRLPVFFQKNLFFYAEINLRLFLNLLFRSKKNTILLANDLDTLPAVFVIAKLFGKPLVFDSHEIFSQLPSLKKNSFQQRVWKGLESFLLPKIKYFYTVSNGYAKWFSEEYSVHPSVIRNVPTLSSPNFQPKKSEEKILLYQGAINASRGIDQMILAMEYLPQHTLWIVGDGPLLSAYQEMANARSWKDRIVFLGRVSPEELREITPKASLGLSLEEDNGLSYRYALPNKVFDYIHAGIPILGTDDLPEVKSIITTYQIGSTIQNHEPKHIAEKVQEVLAQSADTFSVGLKKAAQDLNWESQEDKLLSIFSEAAQDI